MISSSQGTDTNKSLEFEWMNVYFDGSQIGEIEM